MEAVESEHIIVPMTPAQQLRRELFRYTKQEQWLRNDYWNFFLRGRKEIFDAIYDQVPDKDWLNPSVAQLVERLFKTQALDRWGKPGEKWALEGDWLLNRPDILTWMRSSYWKHSKPRRMRAREGDGSVVAVGRVSSTRSDLAAQDDTGATGTGEPSGAKNWMDVMLK